MKPPFVVLLLLVPFLAGCSTEFEAWQGSQQVLTGTGGTKETVEGIDFWTYGSPPVTYRIIGVIQDERRGGLISRATLQPNIAEAARKNGGDGVILVRNESELRGIISSMSASSSTTGSLNATRIGNGIYGTYHDSTTSFGTGSSVPITHHSRTYLVIKYAHV